MVALSCCEYRPRPWCLSHLPQIGSFLDRIEVGPLDVLDNPDFKKLSDFAAAVYNAQQDYLYENDEKLAQLKERLDQEKKKR